MRDLEVVAHARGKTRQAFIASIVRREIDLYKEARRAEKNTAEKINQSTQSREIESGLGIAAATMKQRRQDGEVAAAATSPIAAPLVVNVGNGQATNGHVQINDLERLALFVAKGDEFMRDARKRTVVEVLRATASTEEELKVLVARLEEIIATTKKTKAEAQGEGVGKVARMAFDKLVSLLGD